MKKALVAVATVAGFAFSGQSAVWGAILAGHDTRAAYPFPDLKGAVLVIFGITVIPLIVAALKPQIGRLVSKRFPMFRLSFPFAVLMFGPILGWATGYVVQSVDNQKREKRAAISAVYKTECSRYSAQVSADPGIVLRERWFERDHRSPRSPSVSARKNVFEKSFQPDALSIDYSEEQLRAIFKESASSRNLIACHPNCPPDLIEKLWPAIISSDESWVFRAVIRNRATPLYLLENYQAARISSGKPVSSWLDEAINERLVTESDARSRKSMDSATLHRQWISRPLTDGESEIAIGIFGKSIESKRIRILRQKFIFFQTSKVTMAPDGNIWFHPAGRLARSAVADDFSKAKADVRAHLVHELTHVWQYQNGVNLVWEKILMFFRYGAFGGYDYELIPGKPFGSYNIEQQACIVADAYLAKCKGKDFLFPEGLVIPGAL